MGSVLIILGLLAYTFVCAFLIFIILIQSGKGGGLSSLGSASQGLTDSLGATGAEKTLNKLTTSCAIGFMVLAIALSIGGTHVFKKAQGPIFAETGSNAPVSKTVPTVPAKPARGTQPAPKVNPGAPQPIAPVPAKTAAAPVAPPSVQPATPAAQPAK